MKALIELTIAEKVKRLRGAESQAQAAKRIGIKQPTLSCIELGIRGGSNHATLVKIAQAYGVPVEYLEGDLRKYMRVWAEQVLAREPLVTPGQRLGRLLRELELRYGLTPDHMATALHVSLDSLLLFVEDKASANLVFERMEELTGVPTDILLFGPALPLDLVVLYSAAIAKAVKKGLSPEQLTELIDTETK